jgi:MotA/TolQ/ExbB proton channel family
MNRKLMLHEQAARTMLLWLFWAAAAVAAHVALFLDPSLWAYIKHDPSKITWVTYGLFFIAIFMSFALVIKLGGESDHAAKLGVIAMDNGLLGVSPTNSRRAVERFFLSLKEVVTNNDQPDIEALLNIELAPFYRASNAVEVIGNLLITLGLIGTVVGLTMTLAGLTTTLDALGHDQERLLLGLRSAMGGMGTAFYTTLLGSVLGGVLLRVFSLITEHGIDALAESLRKICMVHCSADTKPSFERELHFFNTEIDALGTNVQKLQAAMTESRQAIVAFREEAVRLHRLGDDEVKKETLRDSIVLQHYYSDLLKQEIRTLNKLNRSWWYRLKEALRR